jgi:hypothetical protein
MNADKKELMSKSVFICVHQRLSAAQDLFLSEDLNVLCWAGFGAEA